jgi:hypothetical protein
MHYTEEKYMDSILDFASDSQLNYKDIDDRGAAMEFQSVGWDITDLK